MTFIAAEAPVNTCTASATGKSASANLVNISTTRLSSRLDAGNASATGTSANQDYLAFEGAIKAVYVSANGASASVTADKVSLSRCEL